MKIVENKYSAIVKDEPTKPLEKIKEYDNDGVHCIEYNDGTVVTSTYTSDTSAGVHWKTKKDYVRQMSWLNKILYYLWVIILYNELPIKRTGHLINNEKFLQTLQNSTYTTYWHWNYWNPLTYVILIIMICFTLIMNVILSIVQIIKMTSIIKIDIED